MALHTVSGMTIGGISDVVTLALQQAINGLDARQRAISSNVANVETPGYVAKEVKFEDSLRSAVEAGSPSSASITSVDSTADANAFGNNVKMDFELLSSAENVMKQKLVVQALNAKYQLLRSAIGPS